MSPSRGLPSVARVLHETVTETVAAATAAEPEAYGRAVTRLAALDAEQLRVVLGAVVRSLLEELYSGGLDGDDLAETLGHAYRGAAPWWPTLDPQALVVLLAGAIGRHDLDDEQPVLAPADVAATAPLLIADLLGRRGRPLDGYLDAALAEIARAETVELP